jgi:hypothetical protein
MKAMSSRDKWLDVLTEDQRKLRKEKRYDEINLTEEQKEKLGEEGCCWIESPSFYAESNWCS